MNNPMEFLKIIRDPKGFVMDYIKSNNNPILNNMIQQAQNGNSAEVEKIANNILKSRGMDLTELMKNIPR